MQKNRNTIIFIAVAALVALAVVVVACNVPGSRTEPTPSQTAATIADLKTATPVATAPRPTYTPLPTAPWTPMPTLSPEDEKALKDVARTLAIGLDDLSIYRDLDSYRQYLSENAAHHIASIADERSEGLATAKGESLAVDEPVIHYDDKRSGPYDYIVTVHTHMHGEALGQTVDGWGTYTFSMKKNDAGNWVLMQTLGWDPDEEEQGD